jgi:transcriptional regulator with AAA-type ATPase domain/NAD-dependent dihydropyrimidine dehydrogenase PreA subunit
MKIEYGNEVHRSDSILLNFNQPLPLESDRHLSDHEQLENLNQWLRNQRIWLNLAENTLKALACAFSSFQVSTDTLIYQEGQTPIGLYLLKSGKVEIFQKSPLGKLSIRDRHPGELFGYTLVANSTQNIYHSNAIALITSEILFLPHTEFLRLIKEYPEIQQGINGILIEELDNFANRIAREEERIRGLQPYIKTLPTGANLIGESKATQKLVQQITLASSNLKPVIFQGQSGTGKTFLAGLIHLKSTLANQPFAELDCATLPRNNDGGLNTDLLFGRIAQQHGILELLEQGTLLLDNVEILTNSDRVRLINYLKTGLIMPNHGIIDGNQLATTPPQPVKSSVRLILASPQKLNFDDLETITVKLFTLPQRKADIPQFADHFLKQFCQQENRPLLKLDRADLRRLISYEYPGNLGELAEILHRAVIMTPKTASVISEQALWSVQSTKNAFRLDLLTHVPGLRQLLLSNWYPEGIWIIMMVIFVPVTILGFIGPQSRDSSITLNLFWAWWWPGYLFLFAFLGRIWCAVCPFMIMGEWTRRFSLILFPRQQLSWPTKWLNRWGSWLLFAGFVIIYLWEKLWDLPHHADLSAWLLVAIALGAVIFSLIYERRLWCRYLCPIGGMNGMFAKLAMTELRSTQQVCATECDSFGCYQGSAEISLKFTDSLPNEGQATQGCPLYSHPAQLQDNRDCMLCMTCIKTCPNRAGQLNLRFPASDLFDHHHGFWAEVALLLLLFGGVFMHHSHRILSWFGWENLPIDADHLLISMPLALILLSIPATLTYITHAIARFFDHEQPDYLTIIYAYLPFALAANLAYYVPSFMMEAGQILPVFARSLGFSGAGLPSFTWSLDVAQFLQGVTLMSAMVFSPYPLLRMTKKDEELDITVRFINNLPHLLLMVGFTIFLFKLMIN